MNEILNSTNPFKLPRKSESEDLEAAYGDSESYDGVAIEAEEKRNRKQKPPTYEELVALDYGEDEDDY